MATPLLFLSNNNNNDPTPTNGPVPTPRPDPSPKPRGRKKAQKGPNKVARRGMGVEKLELELLRQKGSSSSSSSTLVPTNHINHNNFNNNPNPYNVVHPLAGIPVTLTHFRYPDQPGPDPRSYQRVLPTGVNPAAAAAPFSAAELPSMPNLLLQEGSYLHHPTSSTSLCFKKTRVNGEQEEAAVGFTRGKEKYPDHHHHHYQNQNLPAHYNGCNFAGFDLNNNGANHYFAVNNGGVPAYAPGTEVVAIHRKWTSSNEMMEYGFFPGKSGGDNLKDDNNNNNNINNNTNYYYKTTEDLDLKMGCSDSSSSYSSSSSLSSLTTATTTTTSNSSIDLSLKLSSY